MFDGLLADTTCPSSRQPLYNSPPPLPSILANRMITSRKEARILRAAYPLCISLHPPSKRSPAPSDRPSDPNLAQQRIIHRGPPHSLDLHPALPGSGPRASWDMRPAIRGSGTHACANLPPGAPPPHGLLPRHLDAPTLIESPGAPIESPDDTRHPMTARRHQAYMSAARWPSKGAPSRVRRRGEA